MFTLVATLIPCLSSLVFHFVLLWHMRPYHLSQKLKGTPSLVHDIHELVRRSNATDDYLIFTAR